MVKTAYAKIRMVNKILFASMILAMSLAWGVTDNKLIPVLITVPLVLLSIHILLTYPKQVAFTLISLAQALYIAVTGYAAGWGSYMYGGSLVLPLVTLSFTNLTISLVIYFATLLFVQSSKKWLVLLIAFIVADTFGIAITTSFQLPYIGTIIGGLLGVIMVGIIKQVAIGKTKPDLDNLSKLEKQLKIGLYNATITLFLNKKEIYHKSSIPGSERAMLAVTDKGAYYITSISPLEKVEQVKYKGLMSGEARLSDFIGEHVKRATTYSNKNKINSVYFYPVILHSGNKFEMPAEGFITMDVSGKKDSKHSIGTVIIATPQGLLNFNDKIEKKIPVKVFSKLTAN